MPRFPPDAVTAGGDGDGRRSASPTISATWTASRFPVTHAEARAALDDFVLNRLPQFGDWQDTMKAGEATLFHALVSTSLNTGLLSPLEACQAAEAAWRAGAAPLNAVEGFVRQILGWREFVRGVYWLKMPEYAAPQQARRDPAAALVLLDRPRRG